MSIEINPSLGVILSRWQFWWGCTGVAAFFGFIGWGIWLDRFPVPLWLAFILAILWLFWMSVIAWRGGSESDADIGADGCNFDCGD